MKWKTLEVGLWCATVLLLAGPASAQTKRFTFGLGGGFTHPVRSTENRTNIGFNANAAGGVNLTSRLSVLGEFGFNDLNLSQAALSAAGVPGGSTRIYSISASPMLRFNPRGRFDAYVIGGGGFYRRTVEFTQTSVGTVTLFDPFWGVVFPAAVPVTDVLGSFTQHKGGWNVGGGVSFRIRGDSDTRVFAETRYHHIYTTPIRTDILPVTFGFRW